MITALRGVHEREKRSMMLKVDRKTLVKDPSATSGRTRRQKVQVMNSHTELLIFAMGAGEVSKRSDHRNLWSESSGKTTVNPPCSSASRRRRHCCHRAEHALDPLLCCSLGSMLMNSCNTQQTREQGLEIAGKLIDSV